MIKLTSNLLINANAPKITGAGCNIPEDFISIPIESTINKEPTKNGHLFQNEEEKWDYYIGTEFADSVGLFNKPYELTIVGEYTEIIIFFDVYNNGHPNSLFIDDTVYEVESPIFIATNLSSSDQHIITIPTWNKIGNPVIITGISTSMNIPIDYSALKDIHISHSDRADNETPSFGIISNGGSMTILDRSGLLKQVAEAHLLSGENKVSFALTDTLSKKSKNVGTYQIIDWDYDIENLEVRLQFDDLLEELQNINFVGIDLARHIDGEPIKGKVAYDLFNRLAAATPSKFRFKIYNSTTAFRLTKTVINNFYLEPTNLWRAWNKLAEIVQAHIYQDFYGNTFLRYRGE